MGEFWRGDLAEIAFRVLWRNNNALSQVKVSPISNTEFPAQLPDGYPEHLVSLQDQIPALLLTQDLMLKLKSFATDLERMARLEAFFETEGDRIDVEVNKCARALNEMDAQMQEMERILDRQDAGDEILEVRYSQDDLDKLRRTFDQVASNRKNLIGSHDECLEDMRHIRCDTLASQF